MDIETLVPLAFSSGKIRDGVLLKLPLVCLQNCQSEKCEAFHRLVIDGDDNEPHKCPRGFVCCKSSVDNSSATFIGLRIKDISPKSCFNDGGVLKSRYGKDEIRELLRRNEQFISSQVKLDYLNRYIPDITHSLAKVLDSAASNGYFIAEQMLKDPEERSYLNINSAAITVGMAAIQAKGILYSTNIRAFGLSEEQKLPVNVFSKFVRASLTLRHIRKNARIDRFIGQSTDKYMLTPSFGLMPYLILDNALKYSPEGGSVQVEFKESDYGLTITVENIGPFVPNENLGKIWENNYRTENAKKFTGEGSGIGLCTVSSILRSNNLKATVSSDRLEGIKVNGIQMGKFHFAFEVPSHLRCESAD